QAHHRERGPAGHQRGAAAQHVAAVLDGRDGRGVGRGAADAAVLEGAHQRGLRVPRGRGGGVAVRGERAGVERLPLLHLRQALVPALLLVVLVAGGVAALLVRGEEAAEGDHGAGGAERRGPPLVLEQQLDGGGGALRVGHLRGDGALPDQLVQAELVTGELARHLGGGAEVIARGADRLVRLLRRLRLVLVIARLVRHELGAVQLGGLRAGRADRLARERDRIGTHVRDVAVLV